MDSKIRSITEAFSMQPMTLYVGMKITPESTIDRIVQEDVWITGNPHEYYVGYNSNGDRLFEFRKGTVNVMYDN